MNYINTYTVWVDFYTVSGTGL
uniref:Uncharacterized protein n=1 Tax=Anguilla anguilla TaxID=7936 RepID=A0A0E9QXC7_ANGAN